MSAILRFLLLMALISTTIARNLDATDDPPPIDVSWHKNMKPSITPDRYYSAWDRAGPALAAAMPLMDCYDVFFYDLRFNVPMDTLADSLNGDVVFYARAVEYIPDTVAFDFSGSDIIDSIIGADGLLGFGRVDDLVFVDLGRAFEVGDTITFHVFFRQSYGLSLVAGTLALGTHSEGDRSKSWWPCKDALPDKADSFRAAIEVPSPYTAYANGLRDSVVDLGNGRRVWYYTERYPMTTYLFALTAGVYDEWTLYWPYNGGQDSMPVLNAVFPSVSPSIRPVLNRSTVGLTVFSDIFGMYPFVDERYGNALWSSQQGGGTEHQTLTNLSVYLAAKEWTVIHELAHSWWGDAITCATWHDTWLNEGFATYSEALFYERLYGDDYYHDYMDSMVWFVNEPVYVYDTTYRGNSFGLVQYYKGAWVLHMMRRIVGDSLFFAGLRTYYNSEFKYHNAITADFQQLMEQVCDTDLTRFFQDWVYGSGWPQYQYACATDPSPGGGWDVYAKVNQVQDSLYEHDVRLYAMPIEFAVRYASGPADTFRIYNDQFEQMVHFHVDHEPLANVGVVLDPRHWIMKEATKVPWTCEIVTQQEDLSPAVAFVAYRDTITALGGSGSHEYTLLNGALPAGLTLGTNGLLSGTPTETGDFMFTVKACDQYVTGYEDSVAFTLTVTPTTLTCGDIDGDAAGPNVADLTYLVAYVFKGGPEPPNLPAADIDGSGYPVPEINVADLTYLVSYLFRGGPAPTCGW